MGLSTKVSGPSKDISRKLEEKRMEGEVCESPNRCDKPAVTLAIVPHGILLDQIGISSIFLPPQESPMPLLKVGCSQIIRHSCHYHCGIQVSSRVFLRSVNVDLCSTCFAWHEWIIRPKKWGLLCFVFLFTELLNFAVHRNPYGETAGWHRLLFVAHLIHYKNHAGFSAVLSPCSILFDSYSI